MDANTYLAAVEAALDGDRDCGTPPSVPLTFEVAHEIWQRHMHYPGAECVKRTVVMHYLSEQGWLQRST